MKKIVIVNYSRLHLSGVEKALVTLLNAVDHSEYEITLWIPDLRGELQEQLDSRVIVRTWGEKTGDSYFLFVKQLLRGFHFFKLFYSFFNRFLSRLYVNNPAKNISFALKSWLVPFEDRYEAAITYNSVVCEEIEIVLNCFYAKKKIGWIHSDIAALTEDTDVSRLFSDLERLDKIVCVSKSLMDSLVSYYPQVKGKISVIYNLQDINQVRMLAQECVPESFNKLSLVTVGRLTKIKGQEMIPAIARKLKDAGLEFIWYIVGDGPNREAIESSIKENHVEDVVFLTGAKANPYPYIANCTVYVQPSHSEGFCLTTNEAKILSRPVVTTEVAGMREQFNEKEAIFCDDTPESLFDGIKQALDNIEYYKNKARSYNLIGNSAEMQKFYELIE